MAASDSGVYEVTAGGYRRLVEKGHRLIDDVRGIGHLPAGISPSLSRVVANRSVHCLMSDGVGHPRPIIDTTSQTMSAAWDAKLGHARTISYRHLREPGDGQ